MHRFLCAAFALGVGAACGSGTAPAPSIEASTAPAAAPTSVARDAGEALPEGIFPLPAVDATLDDASLAPLKAMVGTASVVGLGDSAPASDGFSQAKARLSKYLVGQMGFRVVAFRARRSEMDRAARFVASCGTPATVAAADSASVRDLLAWMCAFNATHAADPVSIVGFDVDQPEADAQAIRVGVTRAAAGDAPALLAHLGDCESGAPSFDACHDALDAIGMYLVRNAAAVAQRITDAASAELRLALTSYRGGRASLFYASTDPGRAADAREEAMAAVLKALMAQRAPAAKVVVWADGGDLAARRDTITETMLAGTTSMGTALRNDLGGRYQAIDLVGWDVEVDLPGRGYVRAPRPSAASIEVRLHALQTPFLLVDLESAGLDSFFGKGHFELGAPATETLIPREQFRALVFLDTSR